VRAGGIVWRLVLGSLVIGGCGDAGAQQQPAPVAAARNAAERYVSALGTRDYGTVCRYLDARARRELIVSAGEGRTCVTAAKHLFPRSLGGLRVSTVRVNGNVATIEIFDRHSDAGSDSIRMRLEKGRWRVLDL
jgi:hypothetical protein